MIEAVIDWLPGEPSKGWNTSSYTIATFQSKARLVAKLRPVFVVVFYLLEYFLFRHQFPIKGQLVGETYDNKQLICCIDPSQAWQRGKGAWSLSRGNVAGSLGGRRNFVDFIQFGFPHLEGAKLY